ncbi:LAETG motif-containing sortase-dependent surface protein [Uniformispora flossi]|uniref:LAETG motif-containing sortase-dependent surface protein n=1 Tax=Uniformispora flossi TaxID=3390723 RepID=UPI003C2AB1E3
MACSRGRGAASRNSAVTQGVLLRNPLGSAATCFCSSAFPGTSSSTPVIAGIAGGLLAMAGGAFVVVRRRKAAAAL